jgi:uncharacterized protein DUF2442
MSFHLKGNSTSAVEVLGISKRGFWLYVRGEEHFLPFKRFPWFKQAKVAAVLNVKLLRDHHLQWPDLDVDLELESIRSPENYPLSYHPTGRDRSAHP